MHADIKIMYITILKLKSNSEPDLIISVNDIVY